MHFEQSIDIDAPQDRVWEVLSDIEGRPTRIETVDVAELITRASISEGTQVRLKQPKLPEGTWAVTVWDAPSYFEWRQKSGGVTIVAGHNRVGVLGEGRSRLTLTLDMTGLLAPIIGLFSQGPDQPLHDRRGTRHEARRRVRRPVRTRDMHRGTRTDGSGGVGA